MSFLMVYKNVFRKLKFEIFQSLKFPTLKLGTVRVLSGVTNSTAQLLLVFQRTYLKDADFIFNTCGLVFFMSC